MTTSSQPLATSTVLCLFLWMLFPPCLVGQSVGISGGPVSNQLFDLAKEAPQQNIEYQSGSGYFIQLALTDLSFGNSIWSNDSQFDLALDFMQYSGQFRNSITSSGGGSSNYVELQKSVIHLSFFPVKGSFFGEKLKWGAGFGLGAVLNQEVSGFRVTSTPLGSESVDLSETGENYNAYVRFSLLAKVAYVFPITEWIHIGPMYQFNMGLSNEVNDLGSNPQSMLHMVALGIYLSM